MRYFWTFFWTFILAQMTTYVVGSMNSAPFSITTGTILAVGMTLFISLIPEILPKGEEA